MTVRYVLNCRYTPDFILPNGVIIEAKGRLLKKDARKHRAIKKQFPDLDIRFVFADINNRVEGSKFTNRQWCQKYKFQYAERVIPKKWNSSGPNITATSLPDDFVHYSQPRSLTVREWARLQMFPDWYEFSGKRTTGGRRRAGDPSREDWTRETPKYTQIGNAVPVKLAEEIGKHLQGIIN